MLHFLIHPLNISRAFLGACRIRKSGVKSILWALQMASVQQRPQQRLPAPFADCTPENMTKTARQIAYKVRFTLFSGKCYPLQAE